MKNILEYIKVISLIVIAICLIIIVWNQLNILQEIKEGLDFIAIRINELK